MTFKKIFAASLCMAMGIGLTAGAFADQPQVQNGTIINPSYKSSVNIDVIEKNELGYKERIQSELVQRSAPQVGETRAAVEAIYGPSWTSLAPNKNYEIYTNEYDLTDGKMFRRNLSDDALRVYEVTYNATDGNKTANDKVVCVALRVIPKLGDHINLVTRLLGSPISSINGQDGQHVIYGIPKQRYVFYNDVLSSPFEAVNAYFNAEGYMVGQEFMPSRNQGFTTRTTAERFVEFDNQFQPDRKVGK